jgi:L-threonylcarbamoyladenylate synthase
MNIVRVDPAAPDQGAVARAAALLRSGELVALPTETVYGLGANALDEHAVRRIFEAKGRPSYNPLIVHVFDARAARALATAWPESAERLAERFWPGPLTIVLPKDRRVPDLVTAGLSTVALRVPRHPVMRAVLQAAGLPIAAPSANRSGEVSPTTADHVAQSLGERVPLILDAGPAEVGLESTVVDLSGPRPVLLRPGAISAADLGAVIGDVERGGAGPRGDAARRSPGMLERHYAPRAVVRLYPAEETERLGGVIRDLRKRFSRVGVLTTTTVREAGDVHIQLPGDPLGYGRALYAALHDFDRQGCDLILVERPPERPEWAAVLDRLERASRP